MRRLPPTWVAYLVSHPNALVRKTIYAINRTRSLQRAGGARTPGSGPAPGPSPPTRRIGARILCAGRTRVGGRVGCAAFETVLDEAGVPDPLPAFRPRCARGEVRPTRLPAFRPRWLRAHIRWLRRRRLGLGLAQARARRQRRGGDHQREGADAEDQAECRIGEGVAEDDRAGGDRQTLAATLVTAMTGTASPSWRLLADTSRPISERTGSPASGGGETGDAGRRGSR